MNILKILKELLFKFSFFLGPVSFFFLLLIPIVGLSIEAHRLCALLAWIVMWWIFEVLPPHITGLFGVALSVILGVSTPESALAPFAHPIIYLFFGSFIFSIAIQKFELDKLFSLWILTRPFIGNDAKRVTAAIIIITAFCSAWLSNSATTAMMLPVALGIGLIIFAHNKTDLSLFLIAIACSASIGGLLTPVGSPPNLIALGFLEIDTGQKISFIKWMFFSFPVVVLALYFLIFIFFKKINWSNVQFKAEAKELLLSEYKQFPVINRDQKFIIILLSLLIVFWISPGILYELTNLADFRFFLKNSLNESIVALFFSTLLFIIPSQKNSGKKILDWEDGKKIDWGTLLLFGSGLSIGRLVFDTKLAESLTSSFFYIPDTFLNWVVFVFILIYLCIFLSEILSNTSMANIVIPLIIALSAMEYKFLHSLVMTYSLSLAFMLPVGTPPNAIVYGSGHVKLNEMLRFGFILNIFCGLLILIYSLFLRAILI